MLKKALLTLVSTAALSAHAAPVTLSGTNFDFTYDDSTLFGTATVVDDKISFLPTDFKALSNGAGTVPASETLVITITSKNKSTISDISVLERGDYQLNGDSAFVNASARLEVENTTYASANVVDIEQTGNLTSPNDFTLTEWSLNPVALLGDDIYSVRVQLQNNLIAYADQSDYAFIQKKSGQITVGVKEVPIPAAAWLFGSALLALGFKKKA